MVTRGLELLKGQGQAGILGERPGPGKGPAVDWAYRVPGASRRPGHWTGMSKGRVVGGRTETWKGWGQLRSDL